MTANQYRSALKAVGLSQEGAGDLFGFGRRTSQGYALNEYPVPGPIAILLRLMMAGTVSIDDVRKARR